MNFPNCFRQLYSKHYANALEYTEIVRSSIVVKWIHFRLDTGVLTRSKGHIVPQCILNLWPLSPNFDAIADVLDIIMPFRKVKSIMEYVCHFDKFGAVPNTKFSLKNSFKYYYF